MTEKDLNLFVELTKNQAYKFSEEWWDIISDDENFDSYTDYDQDRLDGIFANYNRAIDLLQKENQRLRGEVREDE